MRYMLVNSEGIPIGAIELDDNIAYDIESQYPDLEINAVMHEDNSTIRRFMLIMKSKGK